MAVSATVSNTEDIAKWLCSDQERSAHFLKYFLHIIIINSIVEIMF